MEETDFEPSGRRRLAGWIIGVTLFVVLLVLPDDENHRLLTREIVYTGITRAKKRVMIYGSPQALNRALQRKIQRQSGFMW